MDLSEGVIFLSRNIIGWGYPMGIKLSFSKGNRATKLQRHQRKHLWRDIRGEKVGEEGKRKVAVANLLPCFFFSFLFFLLPSSSLSL